MRATPVDHPASAARAALLGLLLMAACEGKSTSSRAEHPAARAQESALAKSKIPGATGVGRALKVSDSADARRKLEDSISNAPP